MTTSAGSVWARGPVSVSPRCRASWRPPTKWSGSQRYTVMFGQGLSVTAMQAANVFATIANDGVRRQPQLVAGVTGPDGAFPADRRSSRDPRGELRHAPGRCGS